MNQKGSPFTNGFSVFLCILLCTALLAVPVLTVALPSADYSEAENRMLTALPSFSADSLFSGEYTRDLSAFLRDHLPLRATMLKVKSAAEYACAKRENNHVIAAGNGYLVKRFEYTDGQLATFSSNLAALESLTAALSKYQKPVTFLCAPRAIDVLTDLCPADTAEPTERSTAALLAAHALPYVSVTDLLRQKAGAGEKVWYRTDHHWSTKGAFAVYTALGQSLGYPPYPREAFEEITVCDDFFGSSHSASLAPLCRPDTVTAMRYGGDENFVCTDLSTGVSEQGFYRPQALEGKDKYQYFLGRNAAHIRITQNGAEPRPTLLIIKDSYAQSLVPFLARHFDIELIDLRYYRTDATADLRAAVTSPHYVGTLILCNTDTLTGEFGLSHVAPENL